MVRLQRGYAFAGLGLAGLILAGCEAAAPPLAPSEPPGVTVSQPREKEITNDDQYTSRIEAAEKRYSWMHNEDAMAVEKLSAGMRKFYADTRKLEHYVRETQLPRALAKELAR
jgi:hypothetical protein